MTTPTPLLLPLEQRKALLTGLTISLILPLSTTPTPHTIPNLPRRMLFAFSRAAASQLTVADGATSPIRSHSPSPTNSSSSSSSSTDTARSITLPADACTPAALEYLVFWMKSSCSAPTARTITAPPAWRQTLNVYAAAKALAVAEAEKQLYRHVMQVVRDTPLSLARLRGLVEALGAQAPLVREAVRRSAGFARKGELEEAEAARAWLAAEQPGLAEAWAEFDRRAREGRRVDVRWVAETIEKEIERLEQEDREKTEAREKRDAAEETRKIGEKVREVEEKLQRQRRLAGLIE
ncbi:hypothetical protein GTA08_BOTSDO04417 [Botryosphaeria dothidea]|uniref:Uncharacterized protein n=1 Tax=Botryosphaeria dothidea TaxID=55169 RepID=A0A8H4N575_9PEZI|nr:hypothetical protein GTA08_BOTSDO04417 [Botryosphaeria dothidea]